MEKQHSPWANIKLATCTEVVGSKSNTVLDELPSSLVCKNNYHAVMLRVSHLWASNFVMWWVIYMVIYNREDWHMLCDPGQVLYAFYAHVHQRTMCIMSAYPTSILEQLRIRPARLSLWHDSTLYRVFQTSRWTSLNEAREWIESRQVLRHQAIWWLAGELSFGSSQAIRLRAKLHQCPFVLELPA